MDISAPSATLKREVLILIEPAENFPPVSVNNPLFKPVISIEFALSRSKLILPATPFPIVSALTCPPFNKRKFSVFIVTSPAFPVDSVRVNKLEGERSNASKPTISTRLALSVLLLILISPASPDPVVFADISAPSATLKLEVFILTFPPSPAPSVSVTNPVTKPLEFEPIISIDLAVISIFPALPSFPELAVFVTEEAAILPPSFIWKLSVFILTFAPLPVPLVVVKMPLGNKEKRGSTPIISSDCDLISIFPLLPVAVVSDNICPPSNIRNESVRIEIFPAFP